MKFTNSDEAQLLYDVLVKNDGMTLFPEGSIELQRQVTSALDSLRLDLLIKSREVLSEVLPEVLPEVLQEVNGEVI